MRTIRIHIGKNYWDLETCRKIEKIQFSWLQKKKSKEVRIFMIVTKMPLYQDVFFAEVSGGFLDNRRIIRYSLHNAMVRNNLLSTHPDLINLIKNYFEF
jgi:hypothetical protein